MQQDYNCIQAYMVVKPGEQSSGGFGSHQILRVELQPCNSEHGWLFSLYNVWVSICVAVKTLGSLPCMVLCSQPRSPMEISCCSAAALFDKFLSSGLCWAVPVQYLPPHGRFGTLWKSPDRWARHSIPALGSLTSAGSSLWHRRSAHAQDRLPWGNQHSLAAWGWLSARKHSWKPAWVQVNRKESTLTWQISLTAVSFRPAEAAPGLTPQRARVLSFRCYKCNEHFYRMLRTPQRWLAVH